ncbi:sulfotransferase [Frigidibacter sp. SD6-1]|uniref:sulfotransferase n=1 Tax=Frigidibacter sp. SD6-1 TaxID=3032581 RepID=UPI0024DFE1AB|nr:sulfotransferase [Frigidibacter sp. SD6-1]
MNNDTPKKVFVLGDSRTGTTSIHKFLLAAGYRSIHYYFKESGVSQNPGAEQPIEIGMAENWQRLRDFIDTSDYDAFSDYPTRSYYKELIETYPDAFFILSSRESLNVWQRSMTEFMTKFGFKLDIPRLSEIHVSLNERIRRLASAKGVRFLEINIDNSSRENSLILSKFLGLEETIQLGRENASKSYDLRLWSSRSTMFDMTDGDVITYAERCCAPHKGMLSEYGWVFLVNDSSDFLEYLYGKKKWTEEQLGRAIETLKARRTALNQSGRQYLKFVIPEKSAVYPEYLPKIFRGMQIDEGRPAQRVMDAGVPGYSYLADVFRDAKSLGFLYFKGDSHTNWLGAFLAYLHIAEHLNASLADGKKKTPISLSQLTPKLAGYEGDIASQMPEDQARIVKTTWKPISPGKPFEYTVCYELPDDLRSARRVAGDVEYENNLGERPLFVFENDNANLPRAVIFRDSTSDFIVPLLAEHFSRSVFIWHKGQVYEDIIEREKPDVVLHIMAERFFTEYKAFPALSKVLPTGSGPTS